jgi:hypothetical protein
MFEIISNPFENVGEELSGIVTKGVADITCSSSTKKSQFRNTLMVILIIIAGLGLLIWANFSSRKEQNMDVKE